MIVILKIFTNNNNTFDFCWLKHHVQNLNRPWAYYWKNLIKIVDPEWMFFTKVP